MPRSILRKVTKNSLTTYLILSYIIITCVVLNCAFRSFQSFLERETMKMEVAAYQIENSLTGILDYSESLLNSVNRKVVANLSSKKKTEDALKSFNTYNDDYNSVREVLSTGTFFWIDSEKKLSISSEHGYIKAPLDVSNRDYLSKTIKTPWKIFTGSPIVGVSSGQYILPAGVGAVDASGRYVGTVAVGFKIRDLSERLSRVSRHFRTDFVLLDPNNHMVLESTEGCFVTDEKLLAAMARGFDKSNMVVTNYSFFESRSSYSIFRDFEKYPYRVVIIMHNKVFTSGAMREVYPYAIELLILTIFFITLIFLVRKLLKK